MSVITLPPRFGRFALKLDGLVTAKPSKTLESESFPSLNLTASSEIRSSASLEVSSPLPTLDLATIEADPWLWRRTLFPVFDSGSPAAYQDDLWAWFWSLQSHASAAPHVDAWARGFAKSTNVEGGVCAVGATGRRDYVWYISGDQPLANGHVEAIGHMLQSERFAAAYPAMSRRMLTPYGHSAGWSKQRLTTETGYTIDAVGLDVGVRGGKRWDRRPDLIVLDDIDGSKDSPTTIDRKLVTLTRDILPARAPHGAVVVVQNLIHADGIMARLLSGRADFLVTRTMSKHPAVEGLEYHRDESGYHITAGESTWPAVQTIPVLESTMNEIGERAFLAELQHEVALAGQPRFSPDVLEEMRHSVRIPRSPSALPDWAKGIPGLRLYGLPLPGVGYVAYTDPSEGKGKDPIASGIGIPRANGKGFDLVACLEHEDIEPGKHADLFIDLLEQYNTPLWGIERAKGEAVFLVAGLRRYSRLYQHEDTPQTNIQRMAGRPASLRPGFPMTEATKRGLIDVFGMLLESYAIGVPDERAIDQLGTYIVDDHHHTNAVPGGHDEWPIVLAGLALMASQPGVQSVRDSSELGRSQRKAPALGGVYSQWAGR